MRIMISDHRPFVRKGLTSMLSVEPGFHIIEEDGMEVQILDRINRYSPDLLISNGSFGKTSGLDLIKRARDDGYEGKVLLLAERLSKQELSRAKELYIEGIIANTAIQEEFIHALQLLQMGRRYYDSNILDTFFDTSNEGSRHSDSFHQLTGKEVEVLRALGHGLSNRQIAQSLFITEYTVKKHVSQVLSKLELADRTHAALYANAKGIAHYEVSV